MKGTDGFDKEIIWEMADEADLIFRICISINWGHQINFDNFQIYSLNIMSLSQLISVSLLHYILTISTWMKNIKQNPIENYLKRKEKIQRDIYLFISLKINFF